MLVKAYDRVGRDRLWKVLEEYGVKGRLLRAIRSLYVKSEACVRVKDKKSGWFQITQFRSKAGLCHVTLAVQCICG